MIDQLVHDARTARDQAPAPGDARYERYCDEVARHLTAGWQRLIEANRADVAAGVAGGLTGTLVDRLRLGDEHLGRLCRLAADVRAALPSVTRPGPSVPAWGRSSRRRIPKPLGVILMIYEARPTVTIEGALLPVAVGNAVILRGGSELAATGAVMAELMSSAASAAGLPPAMVQVVSDPDRRLIRELLKRHDDIDALIPRGSASLIGYCRSASRIPVIASGGGVNHLYVDRAADLDLAAAVTFDSKISEPTACNTLEMVLVHRDVAERYLDAVITHGEKHGVDCVLRVGDDLRAAAQPRGGIRIEDLDPRDDGREFLDRTIGVRAVGDLAEAAGHIRRHGSGHTEGIVSGDDPAVASFLASVDAAALVVNGSLRLHDGPTLGMGPELSISTGRLHVRGSVDLPALLTYSTVIDGAGTLRERKD